jgi:hypothetical protein
MTKKKIQQSKILNFDFKNLGNVINDYPFVEIEWLDIEGDAGWSSTKDLGKTPLQSVLKLYRPVSLFTEPRSLVPRFSFSAPYNWTLVQQQVLRELGSMHSSA